MNHTEHNHQVAFFRWAAMQHRYPLETMHAIPNAARRSPRSGKWLKDEGLKAGVWDINLPIPQGKYSGLWIEMKAGKNKLTEEQEKFAFQLKSHCMFRVCYSWVEAQQAVIEYFVKGLEIEERESSK